MENPDQIAIKGRASRRLAEEVFDVRLVNQIILSAMRLAPETAAQTNSATPCPLTSGA
jgi:hypothetical protein